MGRQCASWLQQVDQHLKEMGMGWASAWGMARWRPLEYWQKVDAVTRCSITYPIPCPQVMLPPSKIPVHHNCMHSVMPQLHEQLNSVIKPGPATLVNGIQCPLRDKIILRHMVNSKTPTGNIKDGGLEGTPQLFRISQSNQTAPPPNPHLSCSQTPQLPSHP